MRSKRDEEELAEVRAWISAEAPGLAEDFLQLGRQNRASRELKEADVAGRIAHMWARGWTVFDAVIAAMEQSAAMMFTQSEVEDDYGSLTRFPGRFLRVDHAAISTVA